MNGTFLIRTVWPSGSVPPNRLSATVRPSSTTLLAASTSSAPSSRPASRRPFPRHEVLGRDALENRRPVGVPEHDLGGPPHGRSGDEDTGDLSLDGPGVVLGDRELTAGAEPDTPAGDRTGQNDDEVRSETANLFGHPGLGAGPDGHHGDDGAHADDHTERGQRRSEPIDLQGPAGHLHAGPDGHAAPAPWRRSEDGPRVQGIRGPPRHRRPVRRERSGGARQSARCRARG